MAYTEFTGELDHEEPGYVEFKGELDKPQGIISRGIDAGLSMLTPKKSIAERAQEQSASLAGTAAPQIPGVPVRRDYYDKAVAETPEGASVTDTGIVSRVKNIAASDKQGQLGKRAVAQALVSTPPDEPIGLLGTLKEGAKATARSIGAAVDTVQGNETDVVSAANDAKNAPKDPALESLLKDINARKKALGENHDWLDAIKTVGGAALKNPKGAGLLVAEQFPNSLAALGAGAAGMAAGSVAGPAGAVFGGIAGLFGANTALETGNKAIEAASDGRFHTYEQKRVMEEGITKGAVITGIDAATLGMTNFIMGSTRRAVERATVKTLADNGVDVTSKAAMLAASKNPAIVSAVQASQKLAQKASDTLGKNLARVGGVTALETVGEGAGEYLGEMAATGKADKVDAVIEAFSSMGQSAGEIAFTAARNKAKLATIAGKPIDQLSDSVLRYTANRGSKQAKEAAQAEIDRRASQGVDPEIANAPEAPSEAVDRIVATGRDKVDETRSEAAPDALKSNVLDDETPQAPAKTQKPKKAKKPAAPATPAAPASAPQANSAEDLKDVGKIGGGIVDGMYDTLWKQVQAGKTTENGSESHILQGAKMLKDSGNLRTLDQFKEVAKQIDAAATGKTGAERNAAIKNVVTNWHEANKPADTTASAPAAPPTTPEPKTPDAPVPNTGTDTVRPVERFQWMKNKEGGQKYGNLQEIRPLTKELFDKHLKPLLRDEFKDYEAYKKAFPDESHISLFSIDKGKTWKIDKAGPLNKVRPFPANPAWVKKVESFDSPDAITQGKTADSELTEQEQSPQKPITPVIPPEASPEDQVKTPKLKPLSDKQIVHRTKLRNKARERRMVDSDDTMNHAIIKMGGIHDSLRNDLTGDTKGNQSIPFVGHLFTKKGTQDLSDLANRLGAHGYFTDEELNDVDGGAALLSDRLRAEFNGAEPHLSMSADMEANHQKEIDDYNFQLEQQARDEAESRGVTFDSIAKPEDLELAGEDPTAANLVDSELVAKAIAIDPHHTDDIAEEFEGDPAGFMAAIEQFIKDSQREGIEINEDRQADIEEDEIVQENASEEDIFGSDFGLQSQSEEELKTAQSAQEKADKEAKKKSDAEEKARREAAEKKEIEQRGKSAADDFVLGGNALDELAGQKDIFSQPAPKAEDQQVRPEESEDNAARVALDPKTHFKVNKFVSGESDKEISDDLRERVEHALNNSRSSYKVVRDRIKLLPAKNNFGGQGEFVVKEDGTVLMLGDDNHHWGSTMSKSSIKKTLEDWLKENEKTNETPEKEPKEARKNDAAKEKAKQDLNDALGDLADIFGKNTKANLTPEQEKNLMPVLTRVMDAALRLGYYKFKDAARFVLDTIKDKLGIDISNQLTLDHLQGSYIAMSGKYREQGSEGIMQVGKVVSLDEITQGSDDARRDDNQPDSENGNNGDGLGESPFPDEPSGNEQAGTRAVSGANKGGNTKAGSKGVSSGSASTGGKGGDNPVHSENGQFGPSNGTTGTGNSSGSDLFGDKGIPNDVRESNAVKESATESRKSITEKVEQQKKAESLKVVYGSRANIDATLPFLSEGQREDVHFAEQRFAKDDGYGVLFTNGTGTGKTYLGLGIIKRMVKQGKKNGLIVVPNDKMIEDWIDSGKNLGLDVKPLENTTDKGSGIAVTTYANFGANTALAKRDYDFVVTDESQNLMQNAQADNTASLETLRAITLHPRGAYQRAQMLYPELWKKAAELESKRLSLKDRQVGEDFGVNAEIEKNSQEIHKRVSEVRENVESRQGAARPRVVMLSATPFAYEPNIQLAEGYLFEFDNSELSGGYNEPNGYQKFMIQHFGYRMRTGKLNQPDAKVDRSLMQRQFNTWMRNQGALSARVLDVEFDYDRKFVMIDSSVGSKIDEGLDWLTEEAGGRYTPLYDKAKEKFDYLSRMRLLEAIKAEAAIPYIKEYHKLGRQVIVFHDYNEGGGFSPFKFETRSDNLEMSVRIYKEDGSHSNEMVKWNDIVNEFNRLRPDLAKLDFGKLPSPIETLTKAFPNAMLFNGNVSKEKRRQAIAQFNNDDNQKANLLIVQSAANAGWSGHDTTGKHPRVIINLGIPAAPTKAIQQEGRAYRTGQASDASFRYMNTGTNWERWAFSSTIAHRASTAENLAMGEQARGLLQSFIDAFENSGEFKPSLNDGKGGKALDRQYAQILSEYDRAKSFYYGRQKKSSRDKSKEGTDYYATPEPLGFKMVDWLNIQEGDQLLEPSAGHGAIGRWFPQQHERTLVEPSSYLASSLGLVSDAKVLQERFESLNIVNKYDGIAMNPPFGVGGKVAIEHLDKAFKHLHDGGRIVALIPTGPMADKRFDAWMHDTDDNGKSKNPYAHIRANILLPRATFERAGTSVATRIVIIDKLMDPKLAQLADRSNDVDLSGVGEIDALFDRIKDMTVLDRIPLPKPDATPFEKKQTKTKIADEWAYRAEETAKESGVIAESNDNATFTIEDGKLVTNAPMETVTTKAGKELKGVFVPHGALTRVEIKSVDEFTYEPKGRGNGFFVRLRHVVRPVKTPDFSRSTKAATGADQPNVKAIVDAIRARWKNAPETIIVTDMNDPAIPEPVRAENKRQLSMGATGEPEGFIAGGKVYIVASAMNSPRDVVRVLFHEALGHFGLRGVFGSELDAILKQVSALRRKDVEAIAKRYGLNMEVQEDRLKAAEEVLAHLAQTNPQIGFVRRAIAAIRAWLRKTFPSLAAMKMTDDEIINSYLIPARDFVKRGKGMGANGDPSFSRPTSIESLKTNLIEAKNKFKAAKGAPIKELFKLSNSISKARDRLTAEIENLPDDGFVLHGKTFQGKMLLLTQSAQKPGNWQITRFDAKGEPFGDSQYTKKIKGIDDFLREAEAESVTTNDANPSILFSRKPGSTFDSPEPSKMDNIIHALQDKHIDLKRVTEAIKDTGKQIADNLHAYLQEELFHGRTATRVKQFIDKELDPLIKVMRLNGVKMADFEEYLWARHAEERNEQIAKINPAMPDGGSGMDTQVARDYLDNLDPKTKAIYAALAKRVDAINKRSRQILVEYGLESQKTIDTWDAAYRHYVPLMREDMDHAFGNGTGQGFSVKGNATKRATGSKRPVVDILANIAQQREKYLIKGEKNRVATALVGLAKENPNADFWKVDTPPTITQVNKTTGLVEVITDPNYKRRDEVIVARIPNSRGTIKERSVVFNPHNHRAMRMAMSLKNLDQDELGVVLNVSSIVTRYFASINTQYNPIFGIVNLTRDIGSAVLNLTSTPLAGKQKEILSRTGPALLAIYQSTRGERKGNSVTSQWAQLWEEFQGEGGKTGFRDMYKNAQDRADALEKGLNPDWWQTTKIGKVITAGGLLNAPERIIADKAVKPLFDWLSDYNDSMENAVRLATYKTALEQGMSKQQAASLAKNLTVNFNRRGAMGRQIGSLYAFFNASVQGTARLAETMAGPAGKRIIAGGIILGGMQAMLLSMSGMGDDEPPEFVKSRSLILPIGEGKYLSVPMPLGFNVLPNIGRITTEFALSGFKDPAKRTTELIGSILDAFNPVGNAGMSLQTIAPTAFDPLAALAENKDWTGKPIARLDHSSTNPTPGFTRAKDSASAFSKMLAEAINSLTGGTQYQPGLASPSPDQIDYLISQATGGVGREASKAQHTVTSAFTGEELPPHKVPLLGRFYGDTKGATSQEAPFYDHIKHLNGIEAEIKGRMKNDEDVEEFKKEHPEWKLIGAANATEKFVQELRKRGRELDKSSKPNKDELKKLMQEKRKEIITRFNERYKEATAAH